MKSKKKKLKLKKSVKMVIVGLVVILLVIFGIVLFGKSDFQVTLNSKTINVGEDYKNDFKATFKGKDVTSETQVSNDIYDTKVGKYKVTFIYKTGKKEYKQVKTLTIVDKTPPEIQLTRGSEIVISKNANYTEPGYKAVDNYDGDISSKVKVEGKVDTSKEGEYTITYTVSDGNKNKTTVTRKVKVTSKSPVDMSLKDFTLDGLFGDTILSSTKDAGQSYIDDMIFAGDSMPLYYVINKVITGKQLWHKESLNPETALTTNIYVNHMESNMTMPEVFGKYKPKMVLLTLGTNSAAYMEVDYFISCYKKLIAEIKKQSPDTILIIQSIPPVDKSLDSSETGLNNTKINKFNYYLAEMCNDLNIKFLNSAVSMKDSNGQCKEGYCLNGSGEHGIHPSKEGNNALIQYTRTHAYQS